MKVALSIAGSDSGGGAGIQADLATFRSLGVWGTTALTCITAQNPDEVSRVQPLAPQMVAEQIAVVCRRFPIAAIKIGMTYSAPIIRGIARALDEHAPGVPVVLDPVMRATSGAPLLEEGGEAALMDELLPRAQIVTPNLREAEVLATMPAIEDVDDMEEAARRIATVTPAAVLVKGGHLTDSATDILLCTGIVTVLPGERLAAGTVHGTGCTLSSAIAAQLANGESLVDAARAAKRTISRALLGSVSLASDGLSGLGW